MTRTFSIYLDAVRFLAAITVVCCHFTYPQFTGGMFRYQDALSTEAVTIFFVLSGYVICYVAYEKERTLREFAISRCARIYSVAIPAIILTTLIDAAMTIGGSINDVQFYEYRHFWEYLPIFLTFSQQIAGFHLEVFSDGPFWSLSYEVWYYVAFALAFYLRGWPRTIAVAACLAILGLPALIFFPAWLLGCAAYQFHRKWTISQSLARWLTAATFIAFAAFRFTGADNALDAWTNVALGGWPHTLHNGEHFAVHYVTALLVAVNFLAIRYCDLRPLEVPWLRQSIVGAASFTFAIYLGHRPLMDLWAMVIHHDPHSPASVTALLALVMTSVFAFAFVSERQKGRWRGFFKWMLGAHGHGAPHHCTSASHAARPPV